MLAARATEQQERHGYRGPTNEEGQKRPPAALSRPWDLMENRLPVTQLTSLCGFPDIRLCWRDRVTETTVPESRLATYTSNEGFMCDG